MVPTRWFLAALVGVLALSGVAFALAQTSRTVTVEVTVWRSVSDPSLLYVSTRPEGGGWRTLNTPLDMSGLSDSRNFHQSNAVRIEVALPEPEPATAACDVSQTALVVVPQLRAGGGARPGPAGRRHVRWALHRAWCDRRTASRSTTSCRATTPARTAGSTGTRRRSGTSSTTRTTSRSWPAARTRARATVAPRTTCPPRTAAGTRLAGRALAERYDLDLPARDQDQLTSTLAEPAWLAGPMSRQPPRPRQPRRRPRRLRRHRPRRRHQRTATPSLPMPPATQHRRQESHGCGAARARAGASPPTSSPALAMATVTAWSANASVPLARGLQLRGFAGRAQHAEDGASGEPEARRQLIHREVLLPR